MDTIRNAANSAVNTASTYIYGDQTHTKTATTESGTEPVSGVAGKGTAEEPFDKGNEETSTSTGTTGSTTTTGSTGASGSTGTIGSTGVTGSTGTTNPTESSSGLPKAEAPDHGTKIGGAEPSTGADPASGQKPLQKQQGSNRPTDAPSDEQTDAVKDKKDEGEEALKKRDPNDHSGEPMKMHDGSEKKEGKEEDSEHPGQEGGKKHGEDGTGEEWIKTSGLQADGGDFDAAQAGAGKEADRLLGEKGIQKDERGAFVDKDGEPAHTDHKASSSPAAGHSKPKTLDKLKEKLHIGTGKKI